MKWLPRILTWTVHLVLTILLAVTALLIFGPQLGKARVPLVDRYQPLTVVSGSMYPIFDAGDLIVSERVRPDDLAVGDIITFREGPGGRLVTHRIIGIEVSRGRPLFTTKGDANDVIDDRRVVPEFVTGRYAFRVPYGGHLSNFVRKPIGLLLFIGLPGLYLIGSEVRKMFKVLSEDEAQSASGRHRH